MCQEQKPLLLNFGIDWPCINFLFSPFVLKRLDIFLQNSMVMVTDGEIDLVSKSFPFFDSGVYPTSRKLIYNML